MSGQGTPLWSSRERAPAGRRRVAPRAATDSDVTRLVGVGTGAAVAAIAAVLVVVLGSNPAELRSPGPLALPHRTAALDCAACHGAPEQPILAACVGCHGPHPSARRGHRALAERGELPCTRCHRIHRDEGGVEIDGTTAMRYGPGLEQVVPLSPPPPPLPRTRVAVIPVDVCDGCHDRGAARDPLARCLPGGRAAEASTPTLCFDEHRTLEGITFGTLGSARERMTAWELARRVLAVAPQTPRRAHARTPWWSVAGIGTGAGLLALALVRLFARGRLRRRERGSADVAPPERVRLPQIDAATCIGCSACVDACPYDVLELHDYVAQVVRPADCCGLTLCEQRCPNGSLVVADVAQITDRIALDADLQTLDVRGLYVVGDLTGLPLIRNAINQGAHAMRAIAAAIARDRKTPGSPLDAVIIGAGPAGLAAALEAQVHGLRVAVLEQGSVAESIRSFPRGKLVFDQPLGIPLVGDLWLRESTKEELLGHWLRIVRQRAVPILEGHRAVAVDAEAGGGFAVTALHEGQPVRLLARRVVVAIGKRGTPRKLAVPIPEDAIDRVHYALADARSLAGTRVVIVGLGDVAMEAAIALAHQVDTTVTLVARGTGFARGKARNVAEVRRLVEAGRVTLRSGAEVTAVAAGAVGIAAEGGGEWLPFDHLFVMIGTLPPWETLAGFGVRRGPAPLAAADSGMIDAAAADRPPPPGVEGSDRSPDAPP